MERIVVPEAGMLEALADLTPFPALVQSIACALSNLRREGQTASLLHFEALVEVCASSRQDRFQT